MDERNQHLFDIPRLLGIGFPVWLNKTKFLNLWITGDADSTLAMTDFGRRTTWAEHLAARVQLISIGDKSEQRVKEELSQQNRGFALRT